MGDCCADRVSCDTVLYRWQSHRLMGMDRDRAIIRCLSPDILQQC